MNDWNLSLFPTHLHIGRFAITMQALDPVELAEFSASTLRGAFGWSFKRMVCFQPGVKSCNGCLLRAQCPYPGIFEPRPADGTIFRSGANAPASYVLRPPDKNERTFAAGQQFRFEVVLVGSAIDLLPYFAVALQQLKKQGVGRKRGRVDIVGIEALPPTGGEAETVFSERDPDVIYPHQGWPAADWIAAPATSPITVEFETPVLLKSGGKVQNNPAFDVLYRALLRRVSALCSVHTSQPWQTDFRGLAQSAQAVETVSSSMRAARRRRYSTRQEQAVELWGSSGSVTYQGDLATFWPLLQLGQILHVGKGCTFGLGRYRIVCG